MKRGGVAVSCVAIASLCTADASAQPGAEAASRPSTRAASHPASPDGGNLLVRGWLKELLDRDSSGARVDYEQASKRDEAGSEFTRYLALARIAELDAFTGTATQAAEAKKELKAVWSDIPPEGAYVAAVRAILESRSAASDVSPVEQEAGEGQLLAKLRKELAFNRSGARPYFESLYESILQLSGIGRGRRGGPGGPMRQLPPGGRRGEAGPDTTGHDRREEFWDEVRRQSTQVLAQVLRDLRTGNEAQASRLQSSTLRNAQRGLFGPTAQTMVRRLLETDPKTVTEDLLSQIDHFLGGSVLRTTEQQKLLEEARDEGKKLVERGEHTKARDLLVLTWPIIRS